MHDIDSVMIMEAAVGLEELFGISLADGDFQLSHFMTIHAMAAYVRSKTDA